MHRYYGNISLHKLEPTSMEKSPTPARCTRVSGLMLAPLRYPYSTTSRSHLGDTRTVSRGVTSCAHTNVRKAWRHEHQKGKHNHSQHQEHGRAIHLAAAHRRSTHGATCRYVALTRPYLHHHATAYCIDTSYTNHIHCYSRYTFNHTSIIRVVNRDPRTSKRSAMT